MAKKQVRDSAYYEDRPKREHPSIYADLKTGKHQTVTEAAIAAGLKTVRTRLQELKNAWSKASATERDDFVQWLVGLGVTMPSVPAASTSGSLTLIASNRKLSPSASKRIEDIMSKRHLKVGDVMAEMGFRKLNASLGRALHRGDRLQPDVITALQKWLAANSSI
ncbi:hypothetical protein F4695_003813 [Rhizobium soli]|uniref:Uncharacterized protein n=1 Tax=Rhizobium soli TaxID=424798 RepID=A0A7X0MT62_9HYPH|nr:hypothetical protein [Rhizobium soli]MBB6510424.1 hypothetical protein [Rhizobium soli]